MIKFLFTFLLLCHLCFAQLQTAGIAPGVHGGLDIQPTLGAFYSFGDVIGFQANVLHTHLIQPYDNLKSLTQTSLLLNIGTYRENRFSIHGGPGICFLVAQNIKNKEYFASGDKVKPQLDFCVALDLCARIKGPHQLFLQFFYSKLYRTENYSKIAGVNSYYDTSIYEINTYLGYRYMFGKSTNKTLIAKRKKEQEADPDQSK